MSDYLLGIDLGTTNIKAVIFASDGAALASASAGYPLIFPGPDQVEQDPHQWWEAAVSILREVTGRAGPEITRKIRGISISSQLPSLLPLDRDGNVLRSAMIWMDKRSWHELDQILDTMGRGEYVASAGAQPDVAFLPSKILWFKKHEPELFAKTHRILQANGYLNYKLTGVMAMDIDQAALCQCLDLHTLRWSQTMSDAMGLDLNEILPQPSPCGAVIGHVTQAAARETGLASGIPVVAGTSDATASMYATGLSRLGEAAEYSGTTSLVFVGSASPSATDIPIVAKPCPIEGIPCFFNAPINTSGASLKWYLSTLGLPEEQYAREHGLNVFDHLNQLALEAPAGSGGLIYFPYMLGERAPLWNSHAKGMFIGMSLDTQRKHIVRSIFEGTAFAVRHVMDTIRAAGGQASCLRITGGGSKSRTWCRIKASMLHMPVCILDEKTGDVPFGDALIAGHAVGIYPDFSKCVRDLVQVKEVIQPVEEWAAVYDKLYPYDLEMYQHLDKDLKSLKDTMDTLK